MRLYVTKYDAAKMWAENLKSLYDFKHFFPAYLKQYIKNGSDEYSLAKAAGVHFIEFIDVKLKMTRPHLVRVFPS